MIHNPNHQPATTQPFSGYPSTSQPQQPLHAPFATDPYAVPRRDPFYPAGPQHARHRSQGVLGGNNAPHGQAEGPGGWANTGTVGSSFWTLGGNAMATTVLDTLVKFCGR